MLMDRIALVLAIVGGLNWGLVGFFNYNLVSSIFGANLVIISRIIYALVGLASIIGITFLFRDERQHHA